MNFFFILIEKYFFNEKYCFLSKNLLYNNKIKFQLKR
jgi:hypothetical protein